MSTLSVIYLHLDLNLNDLNEEAVRSHLKESIRNFSSILYRQDTTVRVDVQDGSVKTWMAVLGSIYLAIGQYGSFRSGVDQIIQDSKILKEYVLSSLKKDGLGESVVLERKRLYATPDKIRRLFLRIDRFEKNLPEMTKEARSREIRNVAITAERIAYELDVEKDFELFVSNLDNKYRPSAQALYNRQRVAIKREEEYPALLGPQQTNSLIVDHFPITRRIKLD